MEVLPWGGLLLSAGSILLEAVVQGRGAAVTLQLAAGDPLPNGTGTRIRRVSRDTVYH